MLFKNLKTGTSRIKNSLEAAKFLSQSHAYSCKVGKVSLLTRNSMLIVTRQGGWKSLGAWKLSSHVYKKTTVEWPHTMRCWSLSCRRWYILHSFDQYYMDHRISFYGTRERESERDCAQMLAANQMNHCTWILKAIIAFAGLLLQGCFCCFGV